MPCGINAQWDQCPVGIDPIGHSSHSKVKVTHFFIFLFDFIWLLCGANFSKINQAVIDLSKMKYLTFDFNL